MRVFAAISVAGLLALPAVSCAQNHATAGTGRTAEKNVAQQQDAPDQDARTASLPRAWF
jgi:hypothetical protein